MADRLVSVVQAVQWNKQARRVFENKADCLSVKSRLMAALAQPNQRGDHIVQANIKGLVDRLELSQAKAMMPLYEAISNAVDAI